MTGSLYTTYNSACVKSSAIGAKLTVDLGAGKTALAVPYGSQGVTYYFPACVSFTLYT